MPHRVFLWTFLLISSLLDSVDSIFLPPRNTGTKEPDSLFLGMTNPDLTPNMETLGPLDNLVDVDFAVESSFDVILLKLDQAKIKKWNN